MQQLNSKENYLEYIKGKIIGVISLFFFFGSI